MGNIKIRQGVFDTKLELEHAGVAAGFPSPADDYRHETLDFNRDYIRHPEASFYGDVEGDSMRDAGIGYPEMEGFYVESCGLPTVTIDSVKSFSTKVNDYTSEYPESKEHSLYPEDSVQHKVCTIKD